jgi:hypothetical protein
MNADGMDSRSAFGVALRLAGGLTMHCAACRCQFGLIQRNNRITDSEVDNQLACLRFLVMWKFHCTI